MSQWARLVAVILTVGVVAACSSESPTEELEELRAQVQQLTGRLDEREDRIEELEAEVDALEAAAATAPPPTEPAPTTTTTNAPDTADVEAILPMASDLPGRWDEDPFIADLGLADLDGELIFTGPCSFGPPRGVDDPVAAAETGFTSGGFTGPVLVVAALRFDDEEALGRTMARFVDETADCDTFFEDPAGRATVSPLVVEADGADEVAATVTSFGADPDAGSFVVSGDSHDVLARVGPYLIAVSHFAEGEEPDLGVTTAVVETMVERALAAT